MHDTNSTSTPAERHALEHRIGFLPFTFNTDADADDLLNEAQSLIAGAEALLQSSLTDQSSELTPTVARLNTSAWNLLQVGQAMLREAHSRMLGEINALNHGARETARQIEVVAITIAPDSIPDPGQLQQQLLGFARKLRGEVQQ